MGCGESRDAVVSRAASYDATDVDVDRDTATERAALKPMTMSEFRMRMARITGEAAEDGSRVPLLPAAAIDAASSGITLRASWSSDSPSQRSGATACLDAKSHDVRPASTFVLGVLSS